MPATWQPHLNANWRAMTLTPKIVQQPQNSLTMSDEHTTTTLHDARLGGIGNRRRAGGDVVVNQLIFH